MKLRKEFITHEMNGEQVMVSTQTARFSGMVRSNETAALIVNCLKQGTTKARIVDAILEEYDAPRNRVERDVERILDTLRQIGALDEDDD